MPLPDERPRQSVANLIGRFEQQNKRQSSSAAPSIPRSSSSSSQTATDPAKEETKDKREWPPKLVTSTSADKIALTSSSPSFAVQRKLPPVSSQPTTEKPPESAVSVSPEPAKPPAPQKQVNPSSGSRINLPSPAKPRPSSARSKSPAKSPPKSSLTSFVSQPLKPQHTGQSVNSNASTIRSPPKSTPRSVPKSIPVTPSRPKTPATHPNSVSRPKTPSSGLFAPTAASLARSRNALPPLPPSVKKVTLSSSAAERLSKPTAASMSKARTPAHTTTPVRAVKSSAGSVSRGPSKLRVGLAPARLQEAKTQQLAYTTDVVHGSDQLENEHAENGHDLEEAVVSEGAADLHDETLDHGNKVLAISEGATDSHGEALHGDEVPTVQEVVESAVEVSPSPEAPHIEVPVKAVVDDVFLVAEPRVHEETLAEESPVDGNAASNGSLDSREATPAAEEIAEDAVSEPLAVGNDIEDMVIMLESVSLSQSRPLSIVTIPDEHGEIPDEEQP